MGEIASAIFQRAMSGIDAADVVFAWIEDEECFGTLLEIGYAHAKGKPVVLCVPRNFDPRGELWFATKAASAVIPGEDMLDCMSAFFRVSNFDVSALAMYGHI